MVHLKKQNLKKNKQPTKFASQTISCSNYGLTMAKYFFSRQVAVYLVLRRQIGGRGTEKDRFV